MQTTRGLGPRSIGDPRGPRGPDAKFAQRLRLVSSLLVFGDPRGPRGPRAQIPIGGPRSPPLRWGPGDPEDVVSSVSRVPIGARDGAALIRAVGALWCFRRVAPPRRRARRSQDMIIARELRLRGAIARGRPGASRRGGGRAEYGAEYGTSSDVVDRWLANGWQACQPR